MRLEDIGQKVGLSGERVRQILKEAGFPRINTRTNAAKQREKYILSHPAMTNKELTELLVAPANEVNRVRSTNNVVPPEKTLEWRLDKYSNKSKHGCWRWTGYRDPLGYGRMSIATKSGYAHHAAWICANGAITKGMHVLHKCDNRKCVNPKHLYLGTHQDNMRDREMRGRGGGRKLTALQVKTVRRMIKEKITYARIACYFEVSTNTVDRVKANQPPSIPHRKLRKSTLCTPPNKH